MFVSECVRVLAGGSIQSIHIQCIMHFEVHFYKHFFLRGGGQVEKLCPLVYRRERWIASYSTSICGLKLPAYEALSC